MLVKMLTTRRGTEDGFKVKIFREGAIYKIRDHLALTLMSIGACEILPVRYDDYLRDNNQMGVAHDYNN